ncbi:hypothetical protein ACWEDF_05530 [Micromonospora chersina]
MNTGASDGLAGWHDPGPELVQKALARIGDAQHRRVFFERLENPRWVAALNSRNVFDSPPEATTDGAGRETWRPWPEGEYLVRMAALVPPTVVEILVRVSDTVNPYVQDLVVQAALELPPEEARRLVPAIERYLGQGRVRDGEEVVALVERLARAGLRKPAVRIAHAAFRPRPTGEAGKTRWRRRSVAAGLDGYWYSELLPRVVSALDVVLGSRVLGTLCAWLVVFQEASGDFDAASGTDVSYIWRPAVANHEQNNRYHELGDSLVEATRDRALEDIGHGRSAAEVLGTLERSGQPLLTRIGLHVLAATAADHEDAREEGFRRLMDPRLLEIAYRHEYSELGRSVLPLLNRERSEQWEAQILNGPPLAPEELARRAARRQASDEDLDAAVARYKEIWQLNILSAIGGNSLPALAASRLSELVGKYGEVSHAEFPSYSSSSWTGPESPIAEEELVLKSVDEIKDALASWTPDGSEPWGVTKEGLARTFQAVVRRRAWEFSTAAPELVDLDPTYVRALFSGLADGLSEGSELNWQPLLTCARLIALKRDDGAEVEGGGLDEDVVWRFAQRAVASLLEHGATPKQQNPIPVDLLRPAVEALAPLIDHPDPTPEHEERYGGSNMDPLTLSLNTTRPAAIRAIVQIAIRGNSFAEDGEARDRGVGAISLALDLLDRRLGPPRDNSLATAAAFGEALGRLIFIDQDWTVSRAGNLLTDDQFGEVVLSTALATYRPFLRLMDVVAPAAHGLLARAAAGGDPMSGWRTDRNPVELIGDHLAMLYIQGVIGLDYPLLVHFFETAPVKERSRVLGRLGWILMQSTDVPVEALERAKSFWDSRAEAVTDGDASADELLEFYWWVIAEKFDSAWWLPRLEQASRSEAFDPKGTLGEVLEATAVHAPGPVALIFERLLLRRAEPFGRFDLVEQAPAVIAAALESGDPSTVATGERMMDALGRSGHLRIEELVQQHRPRRIQKTDG